MREGDLSQDPEAWALPDPPHGRDHVAEAVHREHCGALEGRGEERAGDVSAMVLHEVHPGPDPPTWDREAVGQGGLRPEDLPQVGGPGRGHAASGPARDRERDAAPEVGGGVAGEGDVVELLGHQPRLLQAVPDGVKGKGGVVLDSGESLLLGRRDELPVRDEGRRGVPVVGVDAEDVHAAPPLRGTRPMAPHCRGAGGAARMARRSSPPSVTRHRSPANVSPVAGRAE